MTDMSPVYYQVHASHFLFDALIVVIDNENSIDNPLFTKISRILEIYNCTMIA